MQLNSGLTVVANSFIRIIETLIKYSEKNHSKFLLLMLIKILLYASGNNATITLTDKK